MKASTFVTLLTLLLLTLGLITSGIDASRLTKQDQNRGASAKVSQDVDQWPSPDKRWGLVIGIDDYEDKSITGLSGASNDAKRLANVLHQNAGFPKNQIRLLTSDQKGEFRVTRASILRALSDLASTLPQDALLLISFSGHGMECTNQLFLLPSDAQIANIKLLEQTAIASTLISEWFRGKIEQVVVIIDACRRRIDENVINAEARRVTEEQWQASARSQSTSQTTNSSSRTENTGDFKSEVRSDHSDSANTNKNSGGTSANNNYHVEDHKARRMSPPPRKRVFNHIRGINGISRIIEPGLSRLIESLRFGRNFHERNRGIIAFAVLYASESGKEAYEDTKQQQGYLTANIVKALEGEAADAKGDVTLSSLIKYIQDVVPEITKIKMGVEQRPYCSVEGYKAENLIIAVVKR